MRPLRLSITAFGPYAETQVIDFTELGDRTFFLIHGPTGAGKTAILDAMCFALYGDTSGARRDGRQMRSDHADLVWATEVVLDFAIGSDVYRVRRNPEQERPKKRGEGTTVMQGNATIWKWTRVEGPDENGTVMATGTIKVNEAVENLLGFKSDQFRQVVVLPQGDFRRLLTANSIERQEILETLFRTELYHRIELFLKDAAKEHKHEIEDLWQRQAWILQESGVQTPVALAQRHAEHVQKLQEMNARINAATQAVNEARKRFAKGERARDLIREKVHAREALAELDARKRDMRNKRAELERARLALSLVDAENSLAFRYKEAERTATIYEQKFKAQQEAVAARDRLNKKLAAENEREPERESARLEVARLEGLTAQVTALEKARLEITEVTKNVALAQTNQAGLQDSLAAVRAAINEKTVAREAVLDMAGRAAALEVSCREAGQIAEKRQALEALRRELAAYELKYRQAKEHFLRTEDDYQEAKRRLLDLQEAWHKEQAAILAGGLVNGIPCPVCGSPEHPAPAASKGQLPSEEDIKSNQRVVSELETARDQASRQLYDVQNKKMQLTGKISDLETELGERAREDCTALIAAAGQARALWEKACRAAEQVAPLNLELEKLNHNDRAITEELDKNGLSLQGARLALESARATLRERESAVPGELRDPTALREAQQAACRRRDRLVLALESARKEAEEAARLLAGAEGGLRAALETMQTAKKQFDEEARSFRERLKESGFKDLQDYREARRKPETIKRLENDIKQYDENLSSARDRLYRAEKAAENTVEPDMDRFAGALAAAEATRDQVVREQEGLQGQSKREDGWLRELHHLSRLLAESEKRYAVLGRLAEVANGKNRYGLTFQRFVLGALLDDVTLAATERLKVMSRGRYHLQRTMDRSRRNAAGGLELEVFDTYTGVARNVSTLSGGETFLASLSLALGLADVVQSYAGGIHLDTIFVDEGFGTLDPESLDFAMRALIDLQKGGRLVGIISHVPELKERIDARLEVYPVEKGSLACFKLV